MMALNQFGRDARRRFVMLGFMPRHRNRDGRHAQQESFSGRSDGAGINRIVAHVGTGINARDHHIRHEIDHAGHGHVHAIGRCAVNEIKTVGSLPHAEWAIQRERI